MRDIRLRDILPLLGRAFGEWNKDDSPRLAAALAFYSILSLTPLTLLAVSVASVWFGAEAARGELVHQVGSLVGRAGAEVVQNALANAHESETGTLASVLGMITLLFGASGVFGELQAAMNKIFELPDEPVPAGWAQFLLGKLFSFGMVLATGFLLVVSLVLSALISGLSGFLERSGMLWPYLLSTVNFFGSLAVFALVFAAIFRYLPARRVNWSAARAGGVLTAILFTLGKTLIGMYLGHAAVATPFGAAGSLVVMVVWIYYSALIVFFGAEVTDAYEKLQRERTERQSLAVSSA